jgi:hypothetical protein
MKYNILYRPVYSLLEVELQQGESICAEGGAMVTMTPSFGAIHAIDLKPGEEIRVDTGNRSLSRAASATRWRRWAASSLPSSAAKGWSCG